MCQLYLGQGSPRRDIDNETALKTWATSRDGLLNYLNHCEADTYFIAAIAMKIQMLPLTKVLTNLAGNSWARTLSGTRAERNEYILLHEFHRNKYICPDKIYGKGKPKVEEELPEGEDAVDVKKKDKYKGGLVFEPEKGLYDKFILVMDFNSLYPSIIQEYNICFTTVDRSETVRFLTASSRRFVANWNSLRTKRKFRTSPQIRLKGSCRGSLLPSSVVDDRSKG